MWIELQIPAHFRKKVASNLFLPILVNSPPKYKRPWLPLPLSATNLQFTFWCFAKFCTRRSNSAPFTVPFSDRSVLTSRRKNGAVRRRLTILPVTPSECPSEILHLISGAHKPLADVFGNIIRIWQESDIEHQVALGWNTMAQAKTHHIDQDLQRDLPSRMSITNFLDQNARMK